MATTARSSIAMASPPEDRRRGGSTGSTSFSLRFYVDHAAGKGMLHLWDGDEVKPHLDALHGTGVRPVAAECRDARHSSRRSCASTSRR